MKLLKRIWNYFKLKPNEVIVLGPFGMPMRLTVYRFQYDDHPIHPTEPLPDA